MTVPEAAWLAALAGLPGMGPARLAALLRGSGSEDAWRDVVGGTARLVPEPGDESRRAPPAGLIERWRAVAGRVDVDRLWAAHVEAGVRVLAGNDPALPDALSGDLEPPAVVFARGDLAVLDRPRVAVVGTRRCTWAGRTWATRLGADLASAGVCVVSGLALGIDGAAHDGALSVASGAAPAAVVGTGLDVVYPRRNAVLWSQVADRGVVLSEYPLGTRPEPWRFPARNRLVAALADVVVVAESHARGGSMHTVEAALERDVPVMAVPGPVQSPAAAGTNALLVAGVAPARDATDVLTVLGLCAEASRRGSAAGPIPGPMPTGSAVSPPTPPGEAGRVLDALGHVPATLEQVAARLGRPAGPVAVDLARLEREGWAEDRGGWWERREPAM